MQQRIEQRAVTITSAGMNHQPRRLVDHQQVFVLKYDVKRDVLGFSLDLALCVGQRGDDALTPFKL